ncbi:hypothetical protein BU15DRAFT_63582 [Melanogaster broomeanus]|nr:hypothetical protein BU15DRAFT_63582 [Melanogaster broomeanus]
MSPHRKITSNMHCRDEKSNSDSSYDLIPVPVQPRRHPRAPTTVQMLADDFDAMTHDDNDTPATEVYPYDGVTEVKSEDQVEQEVEYMFRNSGVYGEWAERREVHHHQATRAELGEYMDEVARRLQRIGTDEKGQLQDPAIRTCRQATSRSSQAVKMAERESKVSMWLEEVSRNEAGLGEFGEGVSRNNSPTQRGRAGKYTADQGTMIPRGVQNPKPTVQRSQSSASQSPRSEMLYSPTERSSHYQLKPQKATVVKREQRAKDPSPTRSERIYTMAELNALTGQNLKNSPRRRGAFLGQEAQYNRSANSNSSLKMLKIKHRMGSPALVESRSSSASSVEIVLASCQPSLLHIAPVLFGLGIRKEEHLRALARMREETRDREMKEEMLKQGVTVLEWAILVDKLQGL